MFIVVFMIYRILCQASCTKNKKVKKSRKENDKLYWLIDADTLSWPQVKKGGITSQHIFYKK